MPGKSSIEWTHSTWNPVTGCSKVSRGCDNCYAYALAHRRLSQVYLRRLPVLQADAARSDPFAVRLWPERLRQPLAWREPRMIFVNSMSDLFHADIPRKFVRQVFDVMLSTDRHIFQVLTKRPARARRFLEANQELLVEDGRLPPHIWIGTSIEDQDVEYRTGHLRAIPACVRFLSCEPLLGPLELDLSGIHWVIVGGESGSGHRPMKEEWVSRVRDRCVAAEVPFFFKQWGGHTPKARGRLLSERTWDEFPTIATAGV